MKKIVVIGVIALFIVVGFTGSSYSLSMSKSQKFSFDGNILYVGGNGSGNYTSIQDAINDASDGDTVFVYNGTYHVKRSSWHGLIINKSINLIGEDRVETIIDGDGCLVVVYLEMMYFVEYVSVNGFTIQNGSTGIYYDTGINNIDNPSYLQNQDHYSSGDFYNNILINNNMGIVVGWWSENVGVYNNIITMNKKGIILDNCFMGIFVFHNTIENNEHGIWIYGEGYGNTISYNDINSNKENGIILSYSYGCTITRNTILNNTNGINISDSSSTNIEYNTISNNKNSIYLFNSISNEIIYNNINSNKDYGIYLHNSYSNQISKNKFLNNRLHTFFIKEYTIWEFIKNYQKDKNIWNENYWNKPRSLPKIIFGILSIIINLKNFDFLVMEFDRNPAMEP